MRMFRLLTGAAVSMLLVAVPLSLAQADDATLSDFDVPTRQFSGAPSAALIESSTRAMNVVSRNDSVFAGGAFSASYSYLEVFHVVGSQSEAVRLLTAAGVSAESYQLTEVQNSAADLTQSVEKIKSAAARAGIAWTMLAPNPMVDGIDVGVPTEPSTEEVQRIFTLLAPLGMKRLGVVPQPALYEGTNPDIYTTPGIHHLNGRMWSTTCEAYSVGKRCWTDIWATTVQQENGEFVQSNGWAFNSLTYVGIPKEQWRSNPLGTPGTWTTDDGRQWRTECETVTSGRNGCRTWVKASYIGSELVGDQRVHSWTSGWLVNNMVRFGSLEADSPSSGDSLYGS